MPVVRVHAKEKLEGKKNGRRAGTCVPKTIDLDDIEVEVDGGHLPASAWAAFGSIRVTAGTGRSIDFDIGSLQSVSGSRVVGSRG